MAATVAVVSQIQPAVREGGPAVHDLHRSFSEGEEKNPKQYDLPRSARQGSLFVF